jgi:hypothetical protein
MAIAFGTAGAAATGTTPLSVAYPTSISAGDLLILFVANKYPTNGPSLPGGFFAPSGNQYSRGGGTPGADTGDVYITVYLRIADGTETGSVSVTVTGANTSIGRMFRYTKSATSTWGYACAGGSDNAAGTSWSVTAGSDPGVTANDMVVVGSGICGNTDTATAELITQTGVTFGAMVERQDSGSNTGDDISMWVTEHPVSSGTGSVAPVYTATVAGTGSATAAGASLFLRLREIPDVTISCSVATLVSAGQTADVIPGNKDISCTAGVADTAGHNAIISSAASGATINCTAGVAVTAGQIADVTPGNVNIVCLAGILVGAGLVSDVQPGPVTIQTVVDILSSAGHLATISSPIVVTCLAGILASQGQLADVQPGNVDIVCLSDVLASSGHLADIQPGGVTVVCITDVLSSAGHNTTITAVIAINCSVGALTAAGLLADIQPGGTTVTCLTGALVASGQTADVQPGNINIIMSAGTLISQGYPAVISNVSPGLVVNCSAGPLAIAGLLSDVQPGGISVSANIGQLLATGYSVNISSAFTTVNCSIGTLTISGLPARILGLIITPAGRRISLYHTLRTLSKWYESDRFISVEGNDRIVIANDLEGRILRAYKNDV